jgi:hypothetical protein
VVVLNLNVARAVFPTSLNIPDGEDLLLLDVVLALCRRSAVGQQTQVTLRVDLHLRPAVAARIAAEHIEDRGSYFTLPLVEGDWNDWARREQQWVGRPGILEKAGAGSCECDRDQRLTGTLACG